MKKFHFLLFSMTFLFLVFSASPAQANQFIKLPTLAEFSRPAKIEQIPRSSFIKGIQVFGEKSGIAFTNDTLFRTDDNGETWREINLPRNDSQKISYLYFLDERIHWEISDQKRGWAILADDKNLNLELATTNDGGNSWTLQPINIRPEDLVEADLENVSLGFSANQNGISVQIPFQTSSNFFGEVSYVSKDNGNNWEFQYRITYPLNSETGLKAEKESGDWILKSEGNCEGFKVGCTQTRKIYFRGKEITPPEIKELTRIEKEKAKLEAENSVFFRPPNGSTRISLNRGFDKCTAASASQMQTWWNNSPFYDSNIYISGRNRGCSQPQLTADWVNQVSAMGWGLIPTIVGYQAPCSTCANCQKHSAERIEAEAQGRGEADIAIADANNLGLTQGTVLYYDMERYDNPSGSNTCSIAVTAFLKGWTDRLKERGYISGVYGSPTNAVNDWLTIPEASRMDAVWLARWDNVMSVWFYASPSPVVPNNVWSNHQRIKQWLGPRNETWGGVTFNIDNNISDAPVAGERISKNKVADFDGDGKTDVSVYRPDAGSWYILNSSNSAFSGIGFGISTDILAPGDYDGDGKTDTAVFRPADGAWYMLTKAAVFSSRQFGSNGDIPVPADFNGDGKTDIAVWRPSNGTWYIANSDSLGTFTFIQFGAAGDKPVQADYDGDGKADIAVFRPSAGAWYVLRSSDGSFFAVNFGISTDQPAQGDFDGDGKTDFVVFREGVWYLLQSTTGFSAVSFGTAGDLPVTGDFDGDNKSDVAVYRPSNGAWYLLQSQNGFTAWGFGISTDKPIPNAYLPQ